MTLLATSRDGLSIDLSKLAGVMAAIWQVVMASRGWFRFDGAKRGGPVAMAGAGYQFRETWRPIERPSAVMATFQLW